MKTIRLLAATLILLALSPQSTMATDQEMSETARKRFEEARSRLELSDEQVELVVPIVLESFQRQKAVLERYGLDIEKLGSGDQPRLRFRQARKLSKELDGVRADTLKELDEILSPSQLKEYERLQSERREATRKRIRAGR